MNRSIASINPAIPLVPRSLSAIAFFTAAMITALPLRMRQPDTISAGLWQSVLLGLSWWRTTKLVGRAPWAVVLGKLASAMVVAPPAVLMASLDSA